MFVYRHQAHLNRQEIGSLRRICLFVTTIYATFWFAAPLSTAAPTNNLCMFQLHQFASVDSKVAAVVEKKMRLHLWYLSEDLAVLSLFCDDISAHDRTAIANKLHCDVRSDVQSRHLTPRQIPSFHVRTISDFVTSRSINLFKTASSEGLPIS